MKIETKEHIRALERDLITLRFYGCLEKVPEIHMKLAKLYDELKEEK